MNLAPLLSKKGLQLAGLAVILLTACKKEKSAPLPFKAPDAYPAKNVFPTAFTADWERVAAKSYLLYVATDSNFAHPLAGYNPAVVNIDSARLNGLTSQTDYYYKVRAIGGSGDTTAYSQTIYAPTPSPTDDRFIYIGSQDMYMYCFYAGNGSREWTYKTAGDIESTVSLNGEIMYFGGTDQRMYALNAITGEKKWNFLTGASILASPALGPNSIYISSWENGTVFGVNTSGGKKWQVSPTAGARIYSSPTYDNSMVFIGGEDQNLYAFNSETGVKVWSASAGDTVVSSPAVSNGTVYVGSFDRNLYAFDEATGALKWKAPTNDSISSSPTVSNGIVYIGSFDNKLYAFDAATGAQKWTYATGGRIFSSPTVSNGTVYVGSYDNNLYAINATTGKIKWAANTGGSIRLASPVVLSFTGNVARPSISGDVQ